MPSHPLSKSLIAASAILGLGLIIGTSIASKTAYKMKALANTISVTGSAERLITSDVAKWSSGFSRTVSIDGLKQGYTDMGTDLTKVKNFIKKSGIDEKTVSTMPIFVTQNNECVSAGPDAPCASYRLSGYTLRQNIIVESDDVKKVSALAQQAGATLAESGIVLDGTSPEYYFSKLSDLKLEMLADATESANQRAATIIKSSGGKLGNVVSAGMGVFQITAVNSPEISDYGSYDTTSVDKKVTAIVRASYTIN